MGNETFDESVSGPKWKEVWATHVKDNPNHALKFEVPLPGEVVKDENFKENVQ